MPTTSYCRVYWSGVLAGFQYPYNPITHQVTCSIDPEGEAARLDRGVNLGQTTGRFVMRHQAAVKLVRAFTLTVRWLRAAAVR